MSKAILLASTLAGLVVAGMSTAASAGDTGTVSVYTGESAVKPDPDQIVCRVGAPVTGTRLGPKRECATQREWDDRREEAQKAVDHSQTRTAFQSKDGG